MKNNLLSKNIALVSRGSGSIGGLEKYGLRIALYLKDLGANVTIVSETPPLKKIEHFNYHTLNIKGLRHNKIIDFSNQSSLFTKNGIFDAIIGIDRTAHQTHLRAGNGIHAAFLEQKRIIGTPFLPLKTWLNRSNKSILEIEKKALFSPRLKRVITNSYQVKTQIKRHYPTLSIPITPIHNGVEWFEMENAFNSWQEQKKLFCKKHGLSMHAFYFLFVGHGFKRKGLAYLLNALSLIPDKDVCLLVVGKDKKSKHFEKIAKNLGLSDRVHFFGEQKNTRPFFQVADSIVIPSIYDPFANVTVEALAMGVYVVSSAYNGGSEVLEHESGTIIEKLTHPESFVLSLKKALKRKKNNKRAGWIRSSVKHLDFSYQLAKFAALIMEDSCHA